MKYKDVQQIAKDTIDFAKKNIKPGMKLLDIRKLCEQKMLELGADSFWYWDVGAFVFAGDETTVSVSGKQYVTSDRIINENDIVTIDLSPQNDNIWGDYARTIILENGVVVDKADVNNVEWRNGLQMEDGLHKELLEFANIETTFEDASIKMDVSCEQLGDYLDELASVDVNVDDIETADGVTATWTDDETDTAKNETDSLAENSDADNASTDIAKEDANETDANSSR